MMVNRPSGSPEGSFGLARRAASPSSRASPRGRGTRPRRGRTSSTRRYVNAELDELRRSRSRSIACRSSSGPASTRRCYELRRSFGWDTRHELTFGVGIRATLPHPLSRRRSADITTSTRTYVPVSDTGVGPTLQYETYTKRYLRLIDFDTLALQEDYRLGHDIVLDVGSEPARARIDACDYSTSTASAQYTVAIRDGFFRARSSRSPTCNRPQIPSRSLRARDPPRSRRASLEARAHRRRRALRYRWRNYLNLKIPRRRRPGLRLFRRVLRRQGLRRV